MFLVYNYYSMRHFTQEEDEFIKNNYHKIGITGCARALNRKIGGVRYRLSIFNLPKLSKEQFRNTITGVPKNMSFMNYKVKADQFINIKNPETAYILGLLWADGFVKQKHSISISGVEEDMIHHISTFKKTGEWRVIRREKHRYGIKTKPILTVECNNIELLRYLEDKDYKSKSYSSACKIIQTIPEELQHFWFRGLFDGDGCFSIIEIGKNNRIQGSISIASSFDQDWSYLINLCKKINIESFRVYKSISKKGHKSSRFSIQRKTDILRFCNYIYQNRGLDKIGLPRKYEKWMKYFNCCNINNQKKLE